MGRLFTAVSIPEEIASPLRGLQQDLHGAAWETDLHITLTYFGEIDLPMTELSTQLEECAFEPFALTPTAIGFFEIGELERAVMWHGVDSSIQLHDLQRKHAAIRARVVGTPDRHGFNPHITLGRLRDVASSDLDAYLAATSIPQLSTFGVDEVHLLDAGVSSGYERVATFPAETN